LRVEPTGSTTEGWEGTFRGQSDIGAGLCIRATGDAELRRGKSTGGSGNEATAIVVEFLRHHLPQTPRLAWDQTAIKTNVRERGYCTMVLIDT
jgi:hypothetical protein